MLRVLAFVLAGAASLAEANSITAKVYSDDKCTKEHAANSKLFLDYTKNMTGSTTVDTSGCAKQGTKAWVKGTKGACQVGAKSWENSGYSDDKCTVAIEGDQNQTDTLEACEVFYADEGMKGTMEVMLGGVLEGDKAYVKTTCVKSGSSSASTFASYPTMAGVVMAFLGAIVA